MASSCEPSRSSLPLSRFSKRLGLSVVALAGAGALSVACSTNTDDLFGPAGGAGGASSSPSTTGSMSTGSQTTTATSTGSQTTTATSTGSQTTSSVSTGTQATSSVSTSATTSSVVSSSSGGPFCGDGIIEGNEQCDGQDLGGHDCTDVGFVDPAGVTCSATCHLKYGGCTNVCGNGVIEPGEQCDDGNTNAFDACSNSCHDQGTTCGTAIPITLAVGQMEISGDTSGQSNFMSTGCQQAFGPELVYAVTVSHAGFFTAWTDPVLTDYDALLYVRAGNNCASASELACGDNVPQEPDLVSIPVQANQVLYFFVDGFGQNQSSGHFDVHLSLSAGTCADPVPILVGDNGIAENAKGTTEGQGGDGSASCGGLGQDVVYAVTRLSTGTVKVATTPSGATPFDSVTYARSSCADFTSEITCNNNLTSNNSAISVDNVDPTTPTYVWIDSGVIGTGPYTTSFGP